MTLKSSFSNTGKTGPFHMMGKLMKEDLKRRLWAITLTVLVFFFIFPVGAAMMLSDAGLPDVYEMELLADRALTYVTLNNGFLVFLMFLLSLIFGVTGYSYLHSKKKLDFYHSIPVRREKLFSAFYIDGILIPTAAYLINLVLGLVIFQMNGLGTGELIAAAMESFGFFLIHYILLYSVTVLSMVLTGNIVIGILGTGVLNSLVPAFLGIIMGYFSEFFVTSYNGGLTFSQFWMGKLSPSALVVLNYSEMFNEGVDKGRVALILGGAVVMAVILTGLALVLYRKRGSEAAGKAMAFQISRPLVRIPIVIVSAMAGGLFFWLTNRHLGWAVFGMICGLLLSHCTIEIIYHFDFRKLFHGKISLLACGAVTAVLFCGFRYDLFGYDRYLPAKEDIAYVSMYSYDLDGWLDYGTVKKIQDGYMWDYENNDDYTFEHMKLTDMDLVYPYLQRAVDQSKDWYMARENFVPTQNRHDVVIQYTLNNGREVYRQYRFYDDEAYEMLKQIYDSPSYKNGVYPVLVEQPEEIAGVRVSQDNQMVNVVMDDQALATEFLRTYQDELLNLKSSTMEAEVPVGAIQFLTANHAAALKEKDQNLKEDYYWIDRGCYPVYPSFHKTLSLLEKAGVSPASEVTPEAVSLIRIDPYRFEDTYGKTDGTSDTVINDRGEIEALLSHGTFMDYTNMNPFFDLDGRIVMSAEFKAGKNTSYGEFFVESGQIPLSVLEKIEADILANPPRDEEDGVVRAEPVY